MIKTLISIDSGCFSVEHPDLPIGYEFYHGTIDQKSVAYVAYRNKADGSYKLFIGQGTLEEVIVEDVNENWGLYPRRLAACGTILVWKSKNGNKGELEFKLPSDVDDVYGWAHVKDEHHDVWLETFI